MKENPAGTKTDDEKEIVSVESFQVLVIRDTSTGEVVKVIRLPQEAVGDATVKPEYLKKLAKQHGKASN